MQASTLGAQQNASAVQGCLTASSHAGSSEGSLHSARSRSALPIGPPCQLDEISGTKGATPMATSSLSPASAAQSRQTHATGGPCQQSLHAQTACAERSDAQVDGASGASCYVVLGGNPSAGASTKRGTGELPGSITCPCSSLVSPPVTGQSAEHTPSTGPEQSAGQTTAGAGMEALLKQWMQKTDASIAQQVESQCCGLVQIDI